MFYVPFNASLSYIKTTTSEKNELRMSSPSKHTLSGQATHKIKWSEVFANHYTTEVLTYAMNVLREENKQNKH